MGLVLVQVMVVVLFREALVIVMGAQVMMELLVVAPRTHSVVSQRCAVVETSKVMLVLLMILRGVMQPGR